MIVFICIVSGILLAGSIRHLDSVMIPKPLDIITNVFLVTIFIVSCVYLIVH